MKMLARAALVALLAAGPCMQPVAAQTDAFAAFMDSVSSPCRHWTAITPSDTTDLATVPKALYVGTGGDLKMIGVAAPTGATGVVWKSVPSSALVPARPRRILATGTTATDIVGCY